MQLRLESDFDVQAVRSVLGVERCWELHTEHMELLRKTELQLFAAAMSGIENYQQQACPYPVASRVASPLPQSNLLRTALPQPPATLLTRS